MRTSINKLELNVAPVIVEIKKEYLTETQDIWTIQMTKYDYNAIRSKIDARMEVIIDTEKVESYICKAIFNPKEVISFEQLQDKEREFNVACELAIKYIKAMYVEEF